jgi:plasmid stability protein
MKTTLDLPDDLMRTVKIRAAQTNRKLKDLIAELLRIGLTHEPAAGDAGRQQRVQLPLVHNSHPAAAGADMTPDRTAQILLQEDESAAVR